MNNTNLDAFGHRSVDTVGVLAAVRVVRERPEVGPLVQQQVQLGVALPVGHAGQRSCHPVGRQYHLVILQTG